MIHLGPVEIDESRLGELCRKYGVRDLSVFGSAARGELRSDSDIDILVDFLPDAEIGLIEYAGLMQDLSDLIGRRVDLISRNGLKTLIRNSIVREARSLYAA